MKPEYNTDGVFDLKTPGFAKRHNNLWMSNILYITIVHYYNLEMCLQPLLLDLVKSETLDYDFLQYVI